MTTAPTLPPPRKRWAMTLLGALLLAQGVGKLLDVSGYLAALKPFDAAPAALLPLFGWAWIAAELAAGAGLLVAGFRADPPRSASRSAAWLALAVAIGYAALTTQASLRGLQIANCTCFGVYLPQCLGWAVLVQDAYMLLYAGWILRRIGRWPQRQAPLAPKANAYNGTTPA